MGCCMLVAPTLDCAFHFFGTMVIMLVVKKKHKKNAS